jgi:hypothetical protein
MAILRDMAAMLSATTGIGTLTLTTAASGFLTFDNAGVPHGGVTVTYLIVDGSNREVGRGVYTFSGLTLTRATVIASTNSNAKISCSGSQTVLIVDSYLDHIAVDEAQATAFTAAQMSRIIANIGGAVYGGMLTPPVLANFTQFGSGATFTQNANANSVSIYGLTTATTSLKGLSIAAPSTPYRAQALIKPWLFQGGQSKSAAAYGASVHVGWTDGTKFHTICLDTNGSVGFDTQTRSNMTTGTGTASSLHVDKLDFIWLAAADNGTNIYFEYSYDGVNYVTLETDLKSSAYLGSGGYTNLVVGLESFCHAGATTFTIGLSLLSWNIVGVAP